MTDMRVALDVDGVLADVILPWLERSNRLRSPLTKDQITTWDFWKACGISQHDFYGELSDCWRDWRTVPPTEGDLPGSTRDLSRLARVDIVTARERSTNRFVERWLDHHGISFDGYVSVGEGTLKAELDYDLFIDDSPINAESFVRKGRPVMLYAQPWNAGFPESRNVTRIRTLGDAVREISRAS